MGIVRILIFASLVAGTFGFFWPSWGLADQKNLEEKTAYLEELCEKDDPYCFRRCSGSGAFGLFCRWPCGRNCRRPSKLNNVQKSSENQSLWDTIWPFIAVSIMALQFYPFVLLCWLMTLYAKFSSMDGLALCLGPWATLLASDWYDEVVLTRIEDRLG